MREPRRIAILGGGPAALYAFKHLVERSSGNFEVDVFEAGSFLGCGMPYGPSGAGLEHVTNVSSNEVPELVTSLADWLRELPAEVRQHHGLPLDSLTEFRVIPRLLFGEYLHRQFELLLARAEEASLTARVHLGARVVDLIDQPESDTVLVASDSLGEMEFEHVIIATGHNWPRTHEGRVPGYFDSPYPPKKLELQVNSTVAIRGASLTAIDAIRTLARANGSFSKDAGGRVTFRPKSGSDDFKILMHSRNGLLPCIRIHLDENCPAESCLHVSKIAEHRSSNEGFLSLDFLFEQNFVVPLQEADPAFHLSVKSKSVDDFASDMLEARQKRDPFKLLRAEYTEAQDSIEQQSPVPWKESLAAFSVAINYPAKHMSAEDMLRLQRTLMPLISLVIAFAPQSSTEELLALHDAGRLDVVAVGSDSGVEPLPEGGAKVRYGGDSELSDRSFEIFVDCTGQPRLSIDSWPFRSLVEQGAVVPARVLFRSPEVAAAELESGNKEVEEDSDGKFFLHVPGLEISDDFQAVGKDGEASTRLWIMAVPFIGGYNPDYSGLDFCDEASRRIVEKLFEPADASAAPNTVQK